MTTRIAPFDPAAEALAHFERYMAAAVAADPVLGTAVTPAGQLMTAGGKRIRPALVILCAGLGTQPKADDVAFDVAMGVELIHTATLVHDDIVDAAGIRRGLPALHQVLGERAAVLVGDYLFARGANLLASAGDPVIDAAVSAAIMSICTGEIGQHGSRHDYAPSRDDYFTRIERKTAALFSAACVCGGRVAGLGDAGTAVLHEFGRLLGMAFQVVDDLLDYTSSNAALGKPAGADLRAGIATLPLMMAMEHDDVRPEIERRIGDGAFGDDDAERIIGLVRECGAIDEAHEVARDLARQAQSRLDGFAVSDGRRGLESLCESVVAHGLGRPA